MPTAVILTTLRFEHQAVLEHLRDVRDEMHSEGTLYKVGRFGAWRVALAGIGIGGAANAALETYRALSHYSPEVALLVGVAGGLHHQGIRLGDVVVATEVYSYDYGRETEEAFEPEPRVESTSRRLQKLAMHQAVRGRWAQRLLQVSLTSSEPRVFVGPIVSGTRAIDSKTAGLTSRVSRKLMAVDLESSGFLQAAGTQPEIETAVVRGISDSGFHKTDDTRNRAAWRAAALAFELLAQLSGTPTLSSKAKKRRLYLKHLWVRDARCFRTLDVSFMANGEPRMVTLLVGRNGSGKTSFLRALALGLCQQKETSALAGELAGEFIRQDKRGKRAMDAEIELSLVDPEQPEAVYLTRTRVSRDESGQEIVRKETEPAEFPWSDIFVCGYGVNRGVGSVRAVPQEYRRSDAMETLFADDGELVDSGAVLQNLKLGEFETGSESREALFANVLRHLKAVLGLAPAHRFDVTSKQVRVRGPWGTMPLKALGDGYRGTSGWLLDLLGRAYLAGGLSNGGSPAGIVLIDEIDEHLHPSWQKKLVPTLRKRFPDLQFVGTTHSAMSIVNCEHSELLASELRGAVASIHPLSGPEGRTADRILRGEWFGLTSTLDDESEALLTRYQEAVRGGAPEDEVAPLRDRLNDRLGVLFDSPIDELALEIAAEMRRQRRAEIPPTERRKLISDAAQRLRQRIEERGFSRGPAQGGSAEE